MNLGNYRINVGKLFGVGFVYYACHRRDTRPCRDARPCVSTPTPTPQKSVVPLYRENEKIFGDQYEAFHEINSNQEKRESIRLQFIADYAKKNNLPVKMVQDYGWPAVELPK